MWNLPLPDDDTRTWYIKALGSKTKNKLDKVDSKVQSVYKSVLLPGGKRDVIDNLLTLLPKDSMNLCTSKMKELMKGLGRGLYKEKDLLDYRTAKSKKEESRSATEKKIFDKYDDVLTELGKIFNYNGFISSNADFSYELSKRKQARTCTYCGREYIYTVEELSDKDEKKHVARPDFDHWMSHELYPMLALNYCNLIPCCPICNRTIKGTKLMQLGVHVHPYINDKEPQFRFSYKLLDINKPQGEVIIVDDNDAQEKATIEMFELRALYRYHSETELDDMLRIGLKNGRQYVEDYLINIMKGLNVSVGNAYRSMFGVNLYEDPSEERPLSKFKRDILKELGILELFETTY